MEPVLAWRDSARPVRIWIFDARLLALLAAWVLWPSIPTTIALLAAVIAFRIAEARGYRLRAALGALAAWSAGERRALSPSRQRRFSDLG